jgi:hypothetical protein
LAVAEPDADPPTWDHAKVTFSAVESLSVTVIDSCGVFDVMYGRPEPVTQLVVGVVVGALNWGGSFQFSVTCGVVPDSSDLNCL